MTTNILDRNIIGFRSGMHTSCGAYAETALAFRSPPASVTIPAPRDHSLARHQTLALPDEDFSVICLAGELWLTREGDIDDHILGPGEQLAVRHGERAVVQALRPSRMRLL